MSIIQGTSKAAGGAVYEIDQSIRFNDGDSPYLNRTFGTPTSSSQFGYSFWVKLGADYDGNYIISANGGGNNDNFSFYLGQIRIQEGGVLRLKSEQLFRDFSSWYHFVVAYDLGNATASQKLRVYLNGSEITSWATDTRSSFSSTSSRLNAAVSHDVGANVFNGISSHINNWDGYIAEFHFVDGTVLTPTDFGEYNDDGVWIPIEASPTYGNNGFYLTGATASDLGEDFSGNSNDFTSSGLATTDQMLDTPTANLPTFNPLSKGSGTLSDGNLQYVGVGSWTNVRLNLLLPETGKWALRFKTTTSYQQIMVGACAPDSATTYGDLDLNGVAQLRFNTLDGNFVTRVGGSRIEDTGPPTVAAQTWFQLLFDMDTGQMGVAADGATSGTFADITTYPIMDLHGASLATARQPYAMVYSGTDSGAGAILDAGQSGWTPAVTGFSALTLANLATPSITDGSAHFQPTLYTGNGSTLEVNQSGNSTFQPDWVWGKRRNGVESHALFDAVRGTTKIIYSNLANAETTNSGLTAFDADGFTIGPSATLNTNTGTYVAWQWKANGAGSSNTDGSINTTATSVNTTAGFSISKYDGSGSNATVGHGLGIAPKMVIVKELTDSRSWVVYHEGIGDAAKVIYLDQTAAAGTDSAVWNSTAPTSTVFSVGTANGSNGSGNTYIAYAFAEVPGYSKFGSYTGNGSTDGPFVYTGFKPAFVMTKRTNAAGDWKMWDNERGPYNVNELTLAANSSGAESSGTAQHNGLLSNGFKIRGNDTETNGSGSTYIYMAFAEHPFGGDGVAPATAR